MTMKKLRLALLIYSYIFIFLVFSGGVLSDNRRELIVPGVLLFPVVLYFAGALTNRITGFSHKHYLPHLHGIKKVFRIYSFLVTTLFFIGAVVGAGSLAAAVLASIFLPLPLHFITLWWPHWKQMLKTRRSSKQSLTSQRPKQTHSTENAQKTSTPTENEIVAANAVHEINELEEIDDLSQKEIILESTQSTELSDEVVGEEFSQEELEESLSGGIKDLNRRQFLKLLGGSSVGIIALSLFFPQKASAAFFGSVPGPGTVSLKDSSGNQIDPAEKEPTDGYRISEIDDSSLPSYYGFVDKDSNWYIAKEDSSGSYRYVRGASSFSTNWTNRASLTYDYFDSIF